MTRDVRVTKLDQEPPFYSMAEKVNRDPLGALREMDTAIERRYGVKHCRVVGLDFALQPGRSGPAILTSPDELIIDVNPPELPA